MPDLQIPALLVPVLGIGLPVAGWYLRKLVERHWKKEDRKVERAERNLEEQRRLLLDLNGDLYKKWKGLADDSDAQVPHEAGPVADEIGTWLYKHSAYFPDEIRPTMVILADMTFDLATGRRGEILARRHDLLPGMRAYIRQYQRGLEEKLGI